MRSFAKPWCGKKETLQTLLEVNNTLVTTRDLQKLFPAISGFIRRMVRHDLASVAIYNEASHSFSLLSAGFSADHRPGGRGLDRARKRHSCRTRVDRTRDQDFQPRRSVG